MTPRSLRLALVVVGLAAMVYGAASVTGAWLGTPPWWPDEVLPQQRQHHSEMGDGREWIGLGVVVLGLVLAVASWPRRQPRLPESPRLAASTPRLVALVVGSALAVYGTASLTGLWLGMPPWWTTTTAPPELEKFWAQQEEWMDYLHRFPPKATAQERAILRDMSSKVEAERARLPPKGVFRWDGVTRYIRPGREWASGGVVAVGLGFVAVGAWPRRRREAAA